ncbi:MAG TPA: hypothetical protein VMW38_10225 [Terriglobia bacterium]|nr:hypothetical protein [Terriglobia bacterium]
MLHKLIAMSLCLLALSGCKKNKALIQPPVSSPPQASTQGPATELENQSTASPIVVDTLPQPPPAQPEPKPSILPPTKPSPPKRTKASSEARKEPKVLPPQETRPVPQPSGGIQLTAQMSEDEKATKTREIIDELDSAKFKLKSVDEASLDEAQKPNLMAARDFIKKSEDLLKRGDYSQSLVLAHKANTLASSLTNQ